MKVSFYRRKEKNNFFFFFAYNLLGGRMSRDNFIKFVRLNPSLINYVKKNNVSWQSLYEIYALYGEDEKIWNNYLKSDDYSINELLSLIKNINLDAVKRVVEGLQKTISLIQDINGNNIESNYEKMPVYEDLDD